MKPYNHKYSKNIIEKIKYTLKNNDFVKRMMEEYKIPLEDLDTNLSFKIEYLDGKFAEGNGHEIILDPKIITEDFFEENFHFVLHELFHWIKRRVEAKFYFKDKEEVESFVISIVWLLLENKSDEEINKKIFPIIDSVFKDKKFSKIIFRKMLDRAKDLIILYKNK